MKAVFCILVSVLSLFSATAQCTLAGPRDGNSFSTNNSIGSYAWSNPSYSQGSNNSYASFGVLLGLFGTATSNYLVVSNPGFTLPAGATICGITVDIERSAGGLGLGASVTDQSVKIVKGGVIGGSEHASGTAWPGADAYASYGGSSDKWGLTWTAADINSSGFGVAVSGKLSTGLAGLFLSAQIDHIRIKVHYSIPSTPVPVTFLSFTANAAEAGVQLNWSTSYEFNSYLFVVEKLAENGKDWYSIDTIQAGGNSTAISIYEAVDHLPAAENVYRIKEIDQDNTIRYSGMVNLSYNKSLHAKLLLYPNPVQNGLFVETKTAMLEVRLADNSGKLLLKQTPMSNRLRINMTDLKPGIYFIRVQTAEGSFVEKIVKL